MFERFLKSLSHEPKLAICMENPLEVAWVGLKIGTSWGQGIIRMG